MPKPMDIRVLPFEFTSLKEELSELTFADRLFIKQKLGSKRFNEILNEKKQDHESLSRGESSSTKKSKESDDESPIEVPIAFSKKKLKKMVTAAPETSEKHVSRDPRFDDLSGNFNETYFHQAYGFLSDVKQREKKKLAKSLKVTKDEEKKKKIESLLKSYNQQEQNERLKEEKRKKLKEMRSKERELIKQGKSPFYVKKSVLKKMETEEKLNKLKSSGNYKKYELRQEKKRLAKERKRISFLQE